MATRHLLFLAFALAGCATGRIPSDAEATPAVDAPDRFLVGSFTDASTREPAAGEGCRSPMVDPRDGTRLILVRSDAGRGDYEVAGDRYGVTSGSLLRLDCATGAVVGVVPQ
jgi:hypothetical protein